MGKYLIEEFDYMYKDTVCSTVKVYEGGVVEVENFVECPLYQAFGLASNISAQDVENLLEDRCYDRNRPDALELINEIGNIDFYDARTILSFSHGYLVNDAFWIRFDFERDILTWDKVYSTYSVCRNQL